MDIAVTGVENVVDRQAVFLADFGDLGQHLRQHAAWYAGILRAVTGADLSHRPKSTFARLPELGTDVRVFAGIDFTGVVLAHDLGDLLHLGVKQRIYAVDFGQDQRLRIG